MTRRMVGAIRNPRTNVLGHCTGRLVTGNRGTRGSSRSSTRKAVFEACAEHDVAVEINSRPERRDPPTKLLELARDIGCLFSIDSDAHAPGQLDFLDYGCERAEDGRHRARPDRQHLAAGPPPGLGERVAFVDMSRRPEVEVRRSQAAPAYRLGLPRRRPDRGADPGLDDPQARRPSGSRRWWPGWSSPSSAGSSPTTTCCERAPRLSDQLPRRAGRRPSRCAGSTTRTSRWGSCTPGDRTIRLSARLQGMPAWVVDYVLVHELAHLLEPGHDATFWAWVDRYPQAERAKGYLLGWSAAAHARAAARASDVD